VHSKQVRRRRAVVGVLVAVSLVLLTAYFGESTSSPLHTLQRGIVEVFSPVEKGASTALSPVRDLAGWFSDTFKAKSEVGKLRQQVARLRVLYDQDQYAASLNAQLEKEVGLQNAGLSAYRPLTASVILRDPNLWYEQIQVDKGSDDGVRLDDPVTGDGELVGDVTLVDPTTSIVTLITDHTMAVAAQVEDSNADTGVLVPEVGDPGTLELQYLPQNAPVQYRQQVVTVGFKSGSLQDLYPPGIPIGYVSDNSFDNLANNGEVQVTPEANLRGLDVVQILTNPHPGSERAQLTTGTTGTGAG
jgi:rod shape-determining protein MreC